MTGIRRERQSVPILFIAIGDAEGRREYMMWVGNVNGNGDWNGDGNGDGGDENLQKVPRWDSRVGNRMEPMIHSMRTSALMISSLLLAAPAGSALAEPP